MFVGRKKETSRLREAILTRQSLLVYGPPDAGKTALLNQTLSSLPDSVRANCITCRSCESPRSMWQALMRSLGEAGDPQVTSRVESECGSSGSLELWIDSQSSLRLRGLLRLAMRTGSYDVFIDAPGPLPEGAYRLLQEWVWSGRTPVFLLARGNAEQDLGRVARLYWHSGLQLELGPLASNEAENLLQHSIKRLRLTKLADAEFRDFVIAQSGGLPGRIVHLCELASQNMYQYDGHIKLHTLAVDFTMRTGAGLRPFVRAVNHD